MGSERMESTQDFAWRHYVNNASPDTTAAEYVPGSLELSVEETTRSGAWGVTYLSMDDPARRLQELTRTDKAGNVSAHDFVETVHFVVDE